MKPCRAKARRYAFKRSQEWLRYAANGMIRLRP